MYETLKKKWDNSKFFIYSGLIVIAILLLTVVYKSDEKIVKKSETIELSADHSDFKTLKEFIFSQIKSPFIASMGSLHPQIGTFKWSRCSNKRVLYALCTFVDIIVNSLICVRAERTGEMFLCLVMEPG